jgi:hypothetical protein
MCSASVLKPDQYVSETATDVQECLQERACQPILFVGSGLSRRYFSGPSWDDLLSYLAKTCPNVEKEFGYYKQMYNNNLPRVGSHFAECYREWAWGSGRQAFPEELFKENVHPDVYIKHAIALHLSELTPKTLECITDAQLSKEISLLQSIRPHAVVTTNYDQFLELVFHEYTPVIGQKIMRADAVAVGEIFKIHGCVSDCFSLVLTDNDYVEFTKKKKYLSAKLLTFFSEHPLLFIGYSANDPNIRAILSDIDEILAIPGGIIPNVYILEWSGENSAERPAREKLIEVDNSKSVRIKAIETNNFSWVFEAFGARKAIGNVSPRMLRALLSRSYELVRHDIPRNLLEVDFNMLEHAVENQDQFAKVFGLTTISNPSQMAAIYPYTLTEVSKKLGENSKSWARAQKAIDKVKLEKGIDIKGSDNRYHCRIHYGKNKLGKYSEDAVELLKKVSKGQAYEVVLIKPLTAPTHSKTDGAP